MPRYGYERHLGLRCRLVGGSKQNYGHQCRPLQPKKKKKVVGVSVGHYKGKKLLWVPTLDLKKTKALNLG